MVALAADQIVPAHKQINNAAFVAEISVAASTVIYKGGFVSINAAGDLVMSVAPVSTVGATQIGNRFIGIAQEAIASQTAAGDAKCKVMTSGYVIYTLTGVTKADVGKPAWLTDDNTLSKVAGGGLFVGWIVDFDSTNIAVIRLPGLGNDNVSAGFITRVSAPLSWITLNDKTLLVHESENHNGIVLYSVSGIVTTVFDTPTIAGIVTVGHTTDTDTTMGCTLTGVDNAVANASIVGAGGCLNAPASASDDALVPAPADKAIIAKCTTAGTGGGPTGEARIVLVALAL